MNNLFRKVGIFGSTGSIGCNSLEVIDSLNKYGFNIEVVCLTTNSKIDELAAQVKRFSPKTVVIQDENAFNEFKSKYFFKDLEILSGKPGLLETASRNNFDLLISALVGFSGLEPTIEAIKSGKDIALANKEALVIAGKLVTELTCKFKNKLIPIDSEHSAILQCITGEKNEFISKIILTASGGPFLNKSYNEIKNTTVEKALIHPNWKMGNKITIDSATMMNKGLEVIEAKWLFGIDAGFIEVLIHPQSIIHSMVEFKDGSTKAQLGIPDMKIPIQYALTYPERVKSDFPKMDFKKNSTLTFEEPDFEKFKCLKIAYEVIKVGGTSPIVMNAANEIAVDLFLKKKIGFLEIPEIIEAQLGKHNNSNEFTLEDIIEIDKVTRAETLRHY
ncbi:MAG: 1-deoxy-D-xylulose-5-phosphate reductoisomerase [Bacteroidota bacterium]|nr:1-deoxy-D-xylulose-5-phosphate reductoisomerase [Bacteroidota bacterium]